MRRGIGLQPLNQQLRLFRCDAGFRSRQIQAVQRVRAVQHMRVRIDDSRDDGLAVQVDHSAVAVPVFQDGGIGTDGLDARPLHGQGRGPGGPGIARIDMPVNEQGVGAECRSLPAQSHDHGARVRLSGYLHPLLPLFSIRASHSRSATATASGRSNGAM